MSEVSMTVKTVQNLFSLLLLILLIRILRAHKSKPCTSYSIALCKKSLRHKLSNMNSLVIGVHMLTAVGFDERS